MVDYITPLHQLPDFVRNQIVAAVGPIHGVPLVQVISRYRGQAEHLLALNRSQQRPYSDVSGIFGHGPLGKGEMDALKAMVDSQPGNHSSLFANLRLRYIAESIPYLARFSETFVGLQVQADRLHAEEMARQRARDQAEEAARQQARQQREEAARREAAAQEARRQAEEAARQLARQQQEEAARREALAQEARRQAEETARQQSLRQAEEMARHQAHRGVFLLSLSSVAQIVVEQLFQQATSERAVVGHTGAMLGEKGREFLWLPGPVAAADLRQARRDLGEAVDGALAEFAAAMDFAAGMRASEALNAMFHALNQSGVNIQALPR